MKNNRREFIKKGTALAALSVVGIGSGNSDLMAITENNNSVSGRDSGKKDVIDTIHYFGKQKKIFKVHFRNVNQPLPHFDGVLIADHIPSMVYQQTGTAFSIGYMKGLVERLYA